MPLNFFREFVSISLVPYLSRRLDNKDMEYSSSQNASIELVLISRGKFSLNQNYDLKILKIKSKTEVLKMPSATHVNLHKVVDEAIGK